jgi:hypothetical protein
MSTHRPDAGFSLAAVIFYLTAASIFIAAVVPSYQMQAKREMEEELIFRGEEYTRAIQKYQRRFAVYPSSVDQLVSTNSLRFLRRAYKDPTTGKEFRLITINPDGTLSGSKTFTQNPNTQPLFGNTQQFGQQQNQQQLQQGAQGAQQQMQQAQQTSQQTFRQGQQPGFPTAGTQQQPGFQVGGGVNTPGTTFGGQQQQSFGFQRSQQPGFPTAGTQQQPGFQAGGGVNTPGTTFGGQQQQSFGFPPQGQRSQQPTGTQGTQISASGIVGVASDSGKESLKVYNNRQKYDEWEFIAILGQSGQRNPNQGSNTAGTNSPGNNPNGPNPAGLNTPQRGFSPTSPSPFGSAGSPLGPTPGAGGTNPMQSPFGFGGTPQQQPNQPRK